ncbi:tryptophan--tRNA ligase [Candidatus Roizmanbacteria bacterium]|nr:tryptophan--tRNA ligase [Candidatus Roizmanbacteria bacterium]
MSTKKEIIFSGIQPSGNLHLGNYLGAIQQWVDMQKRLSPEDTLIFCIVDLHAITVYQDPKILRQKIREVAAMYLACGIDPKNAHIFVQSENPDHTYLSWVLDCVVPYGQMLRMTQFKDKSQKQQEGTTVGLFNYPALMAADILLYDTTTVPVGEDQKQHIELTRDVAEKFNSMYGETFVLPKDQIDTSAARIMSLQNPLSKMSKSDADPFGSIYLLDEPDEMIKKLKRAVTDSGSAVSSENLSPALTNLISIFGKVTNRSFEQVLKTCEGLSYGAFKTQLGEAVVAKFEPIQKKYRALLEESGELDRILDQGCAAVSVYSSAKIQVVKERVGLGR